MIVILKTKGAAGNEFRIAKVQKVDVDFAGDPLRAAWWMKKHFAPSKVWVKESAAVRNAATLSDADGAEVEVVTVATESSFPTEAVHILAARLVLAA